MDENGITVLCDALTTCVISIGEADCDDDDDDDDDTSNEDDSSPSVEEDGGEGGADRMVGGGDGEGGGGRGADPHDATASRLLRAIKGRARDRTSEWHGEGLSCLKSIMNTQIGMEGLHHSDSVTAICAFFDPERLTVAAVAVQLLSVYLWFDHTMFSQVCRALDRLYESSIDRRWRRGLRGYARKGGDGDGGSDGDSGSGGGGGFGGEDGEDGDGIQQHLTTATSSSKYILLGDALRFAGDCLEAIRRVSSVTPKTSNGTPATVSFASETDGDARSNGGTRPLSVRRER